MTTNDITIDIVQTREEHLPSLRACIDEVAHERMFLAFTEAPSLEESRGFVRLLESEGWPHFVALAGDEVIGWIDLFGQPFPGFEHTARLGMGVRQDFRGLGIGRRLMDVVLAAGLRRGFSRIELEVYADNIPAIRLYERFGFAHEGRKIRARLLDGRVQDILLMAYLVE